MNTATSERLIDSTVKPISRAPRSAACSGGRPALQVARDVLEHDDGVVDDEAGRDGERHQRQIVEAVAEQVHHAERADQRDRHGDARDQRWRARCAGTRTPPGSPAAPRSPASARRRAARRGWSCVRSITTRHGRWRRGIAARELREQAAHPVDRVDDVGARLPEDHQQHRRLARWRARSLRTSSTESSTLGDVGEPHRPRRSGRRRSAGAYSRGLEELIVGCDLRGPRRRRRAGPSAGWRWSRPSALRTSSRPMPYWLSAVRVQLDPHRRAASCRRRSPGPRPAPATASAAGCVEAASYICPRPSVSEVSARIMIGASAGLTLR